MQHSIAPHVLAGQPSPIVAQPLDQDLNQRLADTHFLPRRENTKNTSIDSLTCLLQMHGAYPFIVLPCTTNRLDLSTCHSRTPTIFLDLSNLF